MATVANHQIKRTPTTLLVMLVVAVAVAVAVESQVLFLWRLVQFDSIRLTCNFWIGMDDALNVRCTPWRVKCLAIAQLHTFNFGAIQYHKRTGTSRKVEEVHPNGPDCVA